MKKLLPLFITLSLSGISLTASAEDLLQVYQNAKDSNPTLKKALADREAAYKGIGIARGSLLPQLGFSGSWGVSRGERAYDNRNGTSLNGQLELSQSLFNMTSWSNLNIAEKQASIQDIKYHAQQQELILNTATAYFNVLRALDSLSFVEAQKEAIHRQLDQTRQRFKVGLLPITDVQNTQAQYDQTLADEVTARNNLENNMEELRSISGQFYNELNTLSPNKMKPHQPDNVTSLLNQAQDHNLDLLAARLNQSLYREQIRQAESGHAPTLSISASSSLGKDHNYGSYYDNIPGQTGNSFSGENKASLNLSLPIFSGGSTAYSVKQAQYNFVSASEALEETNRAVIKTLRSAHNNISAAISSINAYKQAVISSQSSLDATEAGYKVGTRTIVDVLNATTALYNAKQQLSSARYNYLISLLSLKSSAGILSEADIEILNKDLGKATSTNPPLKEFKN